MNNVSLTFNEVPTCPISRTITVTCRKIAGIPVWAAVTGWLDDDWGYQEQYKHKFLTREEAKTIILQTVGNHYRRV